jgi:glycosyltransferase involved in cell wall biosynthesis
LEFDEVKMLTDLGHEVFSFGSYVNPNNPHDRKRPGIPDGKYNDHLLSVVTQCSQENLHPELIDWADCIIVMHRADWIINNWEKMKKKRVIWRTIGQSVPATEKMLMNQRNEGLQIVRYSPMEANMESYIGADRIIRFYKDPEEFNNWDGGSEAVITVSQSMKKRGIFCGYDIFNEVTTGFQRYIFGPDNADSGVDGGQLSYDELKTAYRSYRAYFYTGTYPASYTLNFIEAMMTGIPIIAIGRVLANIGVYAGVDTYEVDKIIRNGENGFCSDNKEELRGYVKLLLDHPEEASRIGHAGRETAIALFGIQAIRDQWKEFL